MNIMSKALKATMGLGLILSLAAPLQAGEDWSTLPERKQTTLGLYMTSPMAYQYVMDHREL